MITNSHPCSVLVVDDDTYTARAITSILVPRGYQITAVQTGMDALSHLNSHRPDLILLDISMPGMDGLEVCRRVRRLTETPIMMLTSMGDEEVRVLAFRFGANDYLTKPFDAGDLLARIRALLGRDDPLTPTTMTKICIGAITIDVHGAVIQCDGIMLDLAPSERAVLLHLARYANIVVPTDQLHTVLTALPDDDGRHDIRQVISTLRKKIEPVPAIPRVIITEPGIGYRLVPPSLHD